MVLGEADPIEAQRLDEFHPLDHAAKRLATDCGIVVGRWHRPFARQVWRGRVAAGFEVRDFHRCLPRLAIIFCPVACPTQAASQRMASDASRGWRSRSTLIDA